MGRRGIRSLVGESEIYRAAEGLAEKLRDFAPARVVFIKTGGERMGKSIATALGIPVQGLDIRYPASRVSKPLRRGLFPIKELLYKLSRPSVRSSFDLSLNNAERIVLVDDSASSGKTLRLALQYLQNLGLDRSQIRTVVYRRGPGAADVVDCFETVDRVFFRKSSPD